MGVISPVGNDVATFWDALLKGRSGVSRITSFDPTEFDSQIAGQVKDFDASRYAIPPKDAKRADKFIQFSTAAAHQAVADAGLSPISNELAPRAGCIIGCGMGGLGILEEQAKVLIKHGPKRLSPFFIPMSIVNMASGYASIMFNLKGPSSCSVTACASSAHSIAESFRFIQRNQADIMVTGGTEAAVTPLGVGGFCALKALAHNYNDAPEKGSRPFEKNRCGFVIAEGAGAVVLEELEHAKSRGAKIHAELVGCGFSTDAHHITAPDPEGDGALRAMKMALDDAKLNPQEIAYINAHGTSTEMNDKVETLAIKRLFKDHAYSLKVNSTKSITGHLLGAAGSIELIACVLSLRDQMLHPTINYEEPDPDCDLNYVPNKAVQAKVEVLLSNSLGFGGHNASLALRKYRA